MSHLPKKLAFTEVYNQDSNNQVTLFLPLQIRLDLAQLGHLKLNCVENCPEKSHLPKKLAFTEGYNLAINNQVTLHFCSLQFRLDLAQLGHLTLHYIENCLEKSNLLKKLAFSKGAFSFQIEYQTYHIYLKDLSPTSILFSIHIRL